MNITSYAIKLMGKAELPHDLEPDQNYHISLSGPIEDYSVRTNHDGTYTKMWQFKPVKVELLDPLGRSIKLPDTRKNSQLIRARLWKVAHDEGCILDFDLLYDVGTQVVLSMMHEVYREAVKKIENK